MANVASGNWSKVSREDPMFPLYSRRESLSVVRDCLMMADRVTIPKTLQEKVLQLLHEGHPGISRMKALARSYVYWPGMDKDIENLVRCCENCQLAGKLPLKVPLESWGDNTPWSRVHADLAGPLHGNHLLVVVDSFSKWPEVKILKRITASAITRELGEIFARFGNPSLLVTDNGGQFKCSEMTNFCQERGIQQKFTAPGHPQSNGQAEKFVDTVKRSLKKLGGQGSLSQKLLVFLSTYRTTPSQACPGGKSPAELLLGHKPRGPRSICWCRLNRSRSSSPQPTNSL